MCGITGQIALGQGSAPCRESVERMTQRIVHRGPDDSGIHVEEKVAFGFRRLSIIDIAHGHQPMSSVDGKITVAFNGEIYNHAELRAQLEALGHTFQTRCDTEVLVHGYRQWGSDLPTHLSGMFAFACWNKDTNTTLLARDRMGKKPLFTMQHNGLFHFASELKCLLAITDWDRSLDPEAIDIFLAQQFIPAPFTIYEAVKKLLPGHLIEIRGSDVSTRPYWEPSFTPKPTADVEELSDELRSLCRSAVRRRLESEVPLGAFLSGGVDSSIVVGLMAEFSSDPVQTFTIGFDEKEYDERPFARLVSEHFGTQHSEFIVRPSLKEDLSRILGQYDEPYGDKSAVPTYYVSREASKEVTVVLTGDGADDIFAGYGRYTTTRLAKFASSLPAKSRRVFEGWLLASMADLRPIGVARNRLNRFSRRHLFPLGRSILTPGFFETSARARLYRPEFAESLGDRGMQALAKELHAQTLELPQLLDRMLSVDMYQYLNGDLLPKVDISSMAHSLEARSPFLDKDVVDFAHHLPDHLRVSGDTTKFLLKHAFSDLLPKEITHRRKKGFSVPVDRWLAGELAPMMREVLVEDPKYVQTFARPEEIRRLVDQHISGKRRHGGRLWLLLCFELWYRQALA